MVPWDRPLEASNGALGQAVRGVQRCFGTGRAAGLPYWSACRCTPSHQCPVTFLFTHGSTHANPYIFTQAVTVAGTYPYVYTQAVTGVVHKHVKKTGGH